MTYVLWIAWVAPCLCPSPASALAPHITVPDPPLLYTNLYIRVLVCAPQADASVEVGAALRLVLVAGEVAGGGLLRRADAGLRAALSTALPRLEIAAAATTTALKLPTAATGPPRQQGGDMMGGAAATQAAVLALAGGAVKFEAVLEEFSSS